MARKRHAEPATFVYKVSATMPDGSIRTTSRFSRKAARHVAQSFVDGRESSHAPDGRLVDNGRPPAQFVNIHVGTVMWNEEASPFPGDF